MWRLLSELVIFCYIIYYFKKPLYPVQENKYCNQEKNYLLGGSLFSSNALTFQCILLIFCYEVKRLPVLLGNYSNLFFFIYYHFVTTTFHRKGRQITVKNFSPSPSSKIRSQTDLKAFNQNFPLLNIEMFSWVGAELMKGSISSCSTFKTDELRNV